MKKLGSIFNNLTNVLLAFFLSLMMIIVFSNVVLRYSFGLGIMWAEETSRFLFVWLIFLGALAALKDNAHLGVDLLINRLPLRIKRVVFIVSNLIILYTLWIIFDGSLQMTLINRSNFAPVSGISYAYLYGTGIVMSVGMAVIILFHIYKSLFKKALPEGEADIKGS